MSLDFVKSNGIGLARDQPVARDAEFPKQRGQVGRIVSRKSKSVQKHESLLEKHNLLILEFDKRVLRYDTQPFKLVYSTPTNPKREHTPDVLVTTTSGGVVVDVKPSRDLEREHIARKLNEVRNELVSQGRKYVVIDERVIEAEPRYSNVLHLHRYLWWDADEDLAAIATTHLRKCGPSTFSNLLAHLAKKIGATTPSKTPVNEHALGVLMAHGVVNFNINHNFGSGLILTA